MNMQTSPKNERSDGRKRTGGFTLIELLVVIAIIAILAAILLPALSKAKSRAQGIQCMNNTHQIMLGLLIYINDSNGNFPMNWTAADGSPQLNWVSGQMNYTGGQDSTNSALLINPLYSQLAPYVPNPAVYRCPADLSMQYGLKGLPRVRTYSMSQAIGFKNDGITPRDEGIGIQWLNKLPALPSGHFNVYTKETQMRGALGPSDIWILIDENPDSNNDAAFAVQMAFHISDAKWVDQPAKFHNNACGISYADGHSEIHRWRNAGSVVDTTYLSSLPEIPNGTPNSDCLWLCGHTTCQQ